MKENEKIWAIKDGYLVHRDGSIYKLNWHNTGTMRKIKQSKNKDGYLFFGCNGKMTLAHRFIAKCFLPNPNNFSEINHKNEIKNDNRVENLEWCDHRYNINYGTRNKRSSISNNRKVVYQYTLNGEFIREWVSLREIQRVLGYDHSTISDCCKGNTKKAYNSLWFFHKL